MRLARRTLLRGLGALLPLPALEAMMGPKPAQAGGAVAKRWATFYFPHGTYGDDWILPASQTAPVVPSFLTDSLGAIANDIVWINRLDNQQAGKGDHETAAGCFLNCGEMVVEGPMLGKSADQIVGDLLGGGFRFPSLVVSAPGYQPAASCCTDVEICLNNISWRGGTTPATKIQDPRALFDMIFAEDPTAAGQAAAELRLRQRKSILDFADGQGARLQAKLGNADKQRLQDYLDAVREVEMRVEQMGGLPDACVQPPAPSQEPGFEEHNQLMYDMIFLALQCELTPVVTFMQDFEFSDRLVAIPGVSTGHHTCSHHEEDPGKIDQLRAYNNFYAGRFAAFVQRMKDAVDLDGAPMLDNSVLVLSSGLNDGNAHKRLDLPAVIAGTAGGMITPGRVLDADRPLADLWRTIMTVVGASGPEVDGFGDSTGVIDELLT
ncbi:MAG TPA: DUF1552 domain-containing protein [Nannocystaceae bacterium]|nr:DUF1552 domain-containing protein [Nannocystaceae bacterium]